MYQEEKLNCGSKLILKKETIRKLNLNSLQNAEGGTTPTPTIFLSASQTLVYSTLSYVLTEDPRVDTVLACPEVDWTLIAAEG